MPLIPSAGLDTRDMKGASKGNASKNSLTDDFATTNMQIGGLSYDFVSGIVREVISNPEDFLSRPYYIGENETVAESMDGKKLTVGDVYSQRFAVYKDPSNPLIGKPFSKVIENNQFVDFMPLNSIFVSINDSATGYKNHTQIVAFPFFPPHLSLPIKPGEYVWLIKENVRGSYIYYWMCRKVTIRQVDDINLTHLERQAGIYSSYASIHNEGDSANISVDNLEGINNFNADPGGSLNKLEGYDRIALTSIAYREEFTGEPVPRQAKGCGDLLLQGSNNASIYLGTERFETLNSPNGLGDYRAELFSGNQDTTGITIPERKPMSPAIDICLGRKAPDLMFNREKSDPVVECEDLNIVKGFRQDPDAEPLEHMEVEKNSFVRGAKQNLGEFHDAVPWNCIARFYMANSPRVDDIFDIPDVEGENSARPMDLLNLDQYGSATVLAANTRIIGTETVKIQNRVGGHSMIQMTPQGDIIIRANAETGGKIVLEGESGDIRIVPGPNGIVKIGDELGGGTQSGDPDMLQFGLVPVCGYAIPKSTAVSYGGLSVEGHPLEDRGAGVSLVQAGGMLVPESQIVYSDVPSSTTIDGAYPSKVVLF